MRLSNNSDGSFSDHITLRQRISEIGLFRWIFTEIYFYACEWVERRFFLDLRKIWFFQLWFVIVVSIMFSLNSAEIVWPKTEKLVRREIFVLLKLVPGFSRFER